MSGGSSFNYLCHASSDELLYSRQSDLDDMIHALAALGYAPDATRESADVLAEARAAQARLDAKLARLHGVWRAMEWWQSGDTSEANFKADLAAYRGVKLPNCQRCLGTGLEPGKESYRHSCRNPNCAHGKDTA
jgi:hypothetical protein